MKFIDIFNLSKYLKRTGDNQLARIGHVNHALEESEKFTIEYVTENVPAPTPVEEELSLYFVGGATPVVILKNTILNDVGQPVSVSMSIPTPGEFVLTLEAVTGKRYYWDRYTSAADIYSGVPSINELSLFTFSSGSPGTFGWIGTIKNTDLI